ncbi:tetratricopeptide repeat protein [Longispora albida]|uniref:tetratricopeptide repeat protein n=1 Tax=Longispora albida TaxID=203523 RepID=UPI0003801586|nr:tetratricopeptide repeat protein [Longispora albida]
MGDRYEGLLAAGSAAAFGPNAAATVHNHYGSAEVPYVLQQHRDEPAGLTELREMRDQPSKLLIARRQAIPFTGRTDLLTRLTAWFASPARRAAWLFHAPGGQGKTRLASHVATLAQQDGWTTVWARHRHEGKLPADTPEPPAGPLLVLVDYADRWPSEDLQSLLSSAARADQVRVILLARSETFWSQADSHCDDLDYRTTSEALPSLTDSEAARREMFDATCTRFAEIYETQDQAFPVPGPLSDPEYALTLALHMAALAAVDATVHNEHSPANAAGLSEYLLKREAKHWHRLYGPDRHVDARRIVFVAALLGPVDNASALITLKTLGLPSWPGWSPQQLTDLHARCYPAGGQARVLEPLYPDRLAEDFIALTLPGDTESPFADPWSAQAVRTVSIGDIPAPVWTLRPLLLVAAAARRWPHVRTGYLEPMLRDDPGLALEMGPAGLVALAEDPAADLGLLELIERKFPPTSEYHNSLELGIAAVSRRLYKHRVGLITDPAGRASYHNHYGLRLLRGEWYEQALVALQNAVESWRAVAAADPEDRGPDLALALSNLSSCLASMGRRSEALSVTCEAVTILRSASRVNYKAARSLSAALSGLAVGLAEVGDDHQALAASQEAVALSRYMASVDPSDRNHLADALSNLSAGLAHHGNYAAAADAAREAVRIWAGLALFQPETFQRGLARSLNNLGSCLLELGQVSNARTAVEQAINLGRPLARANPGVYEPTFADFLCTLARVHARSSAWDEALTAITDAIVLLTPHAERVPGAHSGRLHRMVAFKDDLTSLIEPNGTGA